MRDSPAVLVLVANADRREAIRRELVDLKVRPISVAADRAIEAVSEFRPIAVLLDDAHASTAPDEFLEATCTHRVRLVTMPDVDETGGAREAALRNAVKPRPFP